jgi:ATPase subunit of ABC transporter with duplicated ATPase domains
MEAATLAKQQLEKDNAKAKDRIADLEDFVRRFRAHKAKARQATSRQKQIEKLKVEDVKPSSRQYPFFTTKLTPIAPAAGCAGGAKSTKDRCAPSGTGSSIGLHRAGEPPRRRWRIDLAIRPL